MYLPLDPPDSIPGAPISLLMWAMGQEWPADHPRRVRAWRQLLEQSAGGGPYALACAAGLRGRVIKTSVVCGMRSAKAPGMKDGISWTLPGTNALLRPVMLWLMALGLRRDREQFMSKSRETMSDVDSQLLEQSEVATLFIDGLLEAFRSGVGGANHEAGLYTRPWGFRCEDIAGEVHLWHGEEDLNVPVSVGRYVAKTIPICRAEFLKDEGHLTLPLNHISAILGVLL